MILGKRDSKVYHTGINLASCLNLERFNAVELKCHFFTLMLNQLSTRTQLVPDSPATPPGGDLAELA